MSKIKKDNKYLTNKFEKEEESANIDSLICKVSRDILRSGGHIWKAS